MIYIVRLANTDGTYGVCEVHCDRRDQVEPAIARELGPQWSVDNITRVR